MPAEQLLSADPKAGVLLSIDPHAGMPTPAVGVHPEAVLRAPKDTESVTLGELVDNPAEAMGRIGAIVRRDVTDPKTWMQVAAAYFGPKVLNAVMPGFANATLSAMKSGKAAAMRPVRAAASSGVSPDVVGIYSPRIANAMRAAQQIRAAMPTAEAPPSVPAPTIPEAVPTSAPTAAASPVVPTLPLAPRTINDAMEAAIAKARTTQPAPSKPLATALNEVQGATRAAKVKLTALETKTAMELVRQGNSPSEALETVVTLRSAATPVDAAAELAKRFGLLSDAEVSGVVAAKNARTTRAKGGTKD